MNMMDSRAEAFSVDSSLINPDFIQKLQDQRAQHKREYDFYMAEAEKHGAADEALASMIQAAEKVITILSPGRVKAAYAAEAARSNDAGGGPNWAEATLTAVPKAPEPHFDAVPSPTQALESFASDDRAGTGGNPWRARLMGSRL